MSKTKYVRNIIAKTIMCPIQPVLPPATEVNKCLAEDCMMWIDSQDTSRTRIGMGYCGILGDDKRESSAKAIFMRIIAWF